jgi:sirohydrochlorin ferrochelatase
VHSLLGVVAERTRAPGLAGGIDVRAAFLDHCAPSLPQVLGSLDDGRARSCVVVPLLLTAAYHSKSDIPAQLAAAAAAGGVAVRCAATLGPHPLLLAAVEGRLREAGVGVDSAADRARTAVVLAAAGSSDPAANVTIADLAARWQRHRGWRAVVPAYASAAGPSPAEAVAALRAGSGADHDGPVVVATYLLAPGYFADKIRAASVEAGASAVSDVLGAAPEVADVVIARYREALCERLSSDTGYAARTVVTTRLVTCSIRGNPRGTDLPARAPRRA